MKNNLLILIFIFLFFSGLSKASEFRFVTSEIKILDEEITLKHLMVKQSQKTMKL